MADNDKYNLANLYTDKTGQARAATGQWTAIPESILNAPTYAVRDFQSPYAAFAEIIIGDERITWVPGNGVNHHVPARLVSFIEEKFIRDQPTTVSFEVFDSGFYYLENRLMESGMQFEYSYGFVSPFMDGKPYMSKPRRAIAIEVNAEMPSMEGIKYTIKGIPLNAAETVPVEKIRAFKDLRVSDIVLQICSENNWPCIVDQTIKIKDYHDRYAATPVDKGFKQKGNDLKFMQFLAKYAIRERDSVGGYNCYLSPIYTMDTELLNREIEQMHEEVAAASREKAKSIAIVQQSLAKQKQLFKSQDKKIEVLHFHPPRYDGDVKKRFIIGPSVFGETAFSEVLDWRPTLNNRYMQLMGMAAKFGAIHPVTGEPMLSGWRMEDRRQQAPHTLVESHSPTDNIRGLMGTNLGAGKKPAITNPDPNYFNRAYSNIFYNAGADTPEELWLRARAIYEYEYPQISSAELDIIGDHALEPGDVIEVDCYLNINRGNSLGGVQTKAEYPKHFSSGRFIIKKITNKIEGTFVTTLELMYNSKNPSLTNNKDIPDTAKATEKPKFVTDIFSGIEYLLGG